MPTPSKHLFVLVIVASAASCGPSAPTAFPRGSAASDLAEEAPVTPVAFALREDPPLPGQSTAGWPGLAGSDAGTSTHQGMGGMDMGGMDMGGPTSGGTDGGHDGH